MDVTMDEVAGVIRLVREVCDHWDDPTAWRTLLLNGACSLANAPSATMLADDNHSKDRFGKMSVIALVGLPVDTKSLLQPVVSQVDHRHVDDLSENVNPGMADICAQMRSCGWVTMAADHGDVEVNDRVTPLEKQLHRHVDWGPTLISIRVVDVPRRPEVINTYRPHGAEAFGPREIALLKLLHDEIAPLVGVRLTTEEHLSRDGLSKRLRETLSLLLEGYSEKQVATALGLATRTVHDYVAMLYEHFQVSSRAERLAYFIRRTPAPRNGLQNNRA
jgi:DNA-binding CsgD family transcriptional regulator